ncbi:MAG: hypothetical protein QW561_05165 [Candidatus Aenigmatarchaeota archaeon]
MKKEILPRAGAQVTLSMRRGRVFKDKKKQAQKWACRKTKGQ